VLPTLLFVAALTFVQTSSTQHAPLPLQLHLVRKQAAALKSICYSPLLSRQHHFNKLQPLQETKQPFQVKGAAASCWNLSACYAAQCHIELDVSSCFCHVRGL
jgi:hypothetical protein